MEEFACQSIGGEMESNNAGNPLTGVAVTCDKAQETVSVLCVIYILCSLTSLENCTATFFSTQDKETSTHWLSISMLLMLS